MRRAAELELALSPRPAGQTLQHWLYQELRAALLCGRLPAGARLPPSRELARQQGVSVTTVLTQLSAIRGKTLFRSVRELLDTLSRMPPLTSVVPVSDPG